MNSPRRSAPRRAVRPTLLLVGEGDTETAFLGHLRSLYCRDGMGVETTIRNAHGKGASNVIKKAVNLTRNIEYNCCVALLDTDIPWTDKDRKLARQGKINLLGSSPCIEGLFLLILNRHVPESTDECKNAIKNLFPSFKKLEWKSYESLFGKEVLKEARNEISILDKLLKYLEGNWSQK